MRVDPRFNAEVTHVNRVPVDGAIAPAPRPETTGPRMAGDAARITRGVRTTLPWSKTRLTKPIEPELDPDRLELSDPWQRARRRMGPALDEELVQDTHDQLDQLLQDLDKRGLRRHPQYEQLARLRDSLARLADREARPRRAPQPEETAPGEGGLDLWDTLLAMVLGPGATLKQAQDRYRQALGHARAGRSSEAIRLLRRAIAGDPDLLAAHAKLGRLLLDTEQYREAERHLQHAASFRPRNYDLQLGLGELYYHLSEPALAQQAFFEAAQLGPRHSDPHAWLGVMAYEAGRLLEAAGSLERAVQLDPANAVARFYLAQVALQLNDPLRADFQIKMVKRLEPSADLSRFEAGRPAIAAASAETLAKYRWRAPKGKD